MKCCICGKKQNPLISDFPLNFGFSDRICAVCCDHKNALERYCKQDYDRYCTEHEYFTSLLQSEQITRNVAEYLKALLSECQTTAQEVQNDNLIKGNTKREQTEKDAASELLRKNFTMTNGFNFEGYTIIKYNCVVFSETVLGTGIVSELSAGFADFFGVESAKMASKFEEARDTAILKLIDKAITIQANALIGLNFNYAPLSGNTIAIIVSATAVTIEKNA